MKKISILLLIGFMFGSCNTNQNSDTITKNLTEKEDIELIKLEKNRGLNESFTTRKAALKANPETLSDVLYYLPKGKYVKILEYSGNNYYKVNYNDTIGFISDIFLKTVKEMTVFKEKFELRRTQIETKKLESISKEFKGLYLELMRFTNTSEFKKYGFGAGGKYKDWLIRVEELKENPDSELLLKIGITVADLEMLGLEYASSRGESTENIKYFNKIFVEGLESINIW